MLYDLASDGVVKPTAENKHSKFFITSDVNFVVRFNNFRRRLYRGAVLRLTVKHVDLT